MVYTEHKDAESFLSVARAALERHESANGLMLGICLRLAREPNAYGMQPYLATVESAAGLRAAVVMTPPQKLQVYSEDDHDSAALRLVTDGLLRGQWPVPGVIAREAAAETFASIWCRQTSARCRKGMRQRIYELRQVAHPTYPSGHFAQATAEHSEFVRPWAHGFHEECFHDDRYEQAVRLADDKVKRGDIFLWIDGAPRSMAAKTRPTPHGQAISYVFTPPEYRRKGYATAVVARLSQRILDEGKQFCTLYTDLSNPTSNSIYGRIGYRGVADVIDVHFEGGPDSHKAQPTS